MAEEIKLIIQQLPTLLQFYVPGYIFILIYDFISSKKRSDGVNLHLECVVISYVLVIVTEIILVAMKVTFSNKISVIIELCVAIVCSYLFAKFMESNLCDKMLSFLKISKSPRASIWDDVIDTQFGTFATIYLHEASLIYQGRIVKYDYESEESNYIALAYYEVYNYDGDKIEEQSTNQEVCLLKLDSIDRVKFYYHEDSRITKKIVLNVEVEEENNE